MGEKQNGERATYVIDGYNVIRRDTQLRATEAEHGLEEGRKTLLNQIADSRQLVKARVIVVFDGAAAGAAHRTQSPRSGFAVVFSVPPQNADQRIVSILKSRHNDSSMTVVTADRELQWDVRKLGARAVDPADFIAQFFARKRPRLKPIEPPITTAKEIAWGIETFGDGIIKTEAAVKTASPMSPEARNANVDDKKERNKKRYLRQHARKR